MKISSIDAHRYINLMLLLNSSDIKCEDLRRINGEEYKSIVAALKEKVSIAEFEPDEEGILNREPPILHFGRHFHLSGSSAWSEIIESMQSRIQEAYYVKTGECDKCVGKNLILFCYGSDKESWRLLCGEEGYLLICLDCLAIHGFLCYLLN